jgi:hypothetical protein
MEMEQQQETTKSVIKNTTKKRNPFKGRKMQTHPCCWCGEPTTCINKTKTLKCWDCRMKMIKDYQHQHNALNTHQHYL